MKEIYWVSKVANNSPAIPSEAERHGASCRKHTGEAAVAAWPSNLSATEKHQGHENGKSPWTLIGLAVCP